MQSGSTSPLVAVLAGGRGNRLGGGKPRTLLGGMALVDHVLNSARGAGLDAIVVAKRATQLPQLDIPVLIEPDEPHHPLTGLLAAETYAGARPLLLAACDMPFLSPELLGWLAARPEDVVALEREAWLQPFPLLLRRRAATDLLAASAAGARMRDVISEMNPVIVGENELRRFGDPQTLLMTVNTPIDLDAAERLLDSSD